MFSSAFPSSSGYCRFEVGVRVEGYAVGEGKRHINSAFFTFRPVDTDCQLPELITDAEVHNYIVAVVQCFMK